MKCEIQGQGDSFSWIRNNWILFAIACISNFVYFAACKTIFCNRLHALTSFIKISVQPIWKFQYVRKCLQINIGCVLNIGYFQSSLDKKVDDERQGAASSAPRDEKVKFNTENICLNLYFTLCLIKNLNFWNISYTFCNAWCIFFRLSQFLQLIEQRTRSPSRQQISVVLDRRPQLAPFARSPLSKAKGTKVVAIK